MPSLSSADSTAYRSHTHPSGHRHWLRSHGHRRGGRERPPSCDRRLGCANDPDRVCRNRDRGRGDRPCAESGRGNFDGEEEKRFCDAESDGDRDRGLNQIAKMRMEEYAPTANGM